MKNVYLFILLSALISGCNSGGISKKDLVGNYSATISVDSTVTAGMDKENLNMVVGMMQMAKISYKFNEDGTGNYAVNMGTMNNAIDLKWEMAGKDSLKITNEQKTQTFQLVKNDKGFRLKSKEGIDFILTKQ